MGHVTASKYVVNAGWDDVPHLDSTTKAKMLASTAPHLRKARAKGEPSLGAGAIYPVEEEFIRVDPFAIPPHWRRCYAMDVGWNWTVVIWIAIDPDTDIAYVYSEHYAGQAQPPIHASAVKARGIWIPGVIDPAANGRSQIDGERLFVLYSNEGLNILRADNSVEAGIYAVWERLETGRLKVFSTCTNWFAEHRIYRRDENGKIVKKKDHAMDATRYGVMSGLKRAISKPVVQIVGNAGVVADGRAGY